MYPIFKHLIHNSHIVYACVCVCVRERERERERERNSLPRKEVAQTDGLKLVGYPFLAHFTNPNQFSALLLAKQPSHLHLCFV